MYIPVYLHLFLYKNTYYNTFKWLFLLVLLFPDWLMYGQTIQQYPIKISGVVFDCDSLIPLPNTHYRIDNRYLAGATNMLGRFEVRVNNNDTLKFTYVGYKEFCFVIGDTLHPGEYLVGIMMSKDTILINEVVILPRRRDLRQEFIGIQPEPDPELENARRNLKISTYQGVSGKGVKWDSDLSFEWQTKRMELEALNRGMIPPDQMIAINFLVGIPYLIYVISENEESKISREIFISESEYKNLIENYRIMIYNSNLKNN